MKPKVLTETQAAALMGVSAATLYRLRRDGKIHHYRKIGRLIKYLPQDVDDNLAELAAYKPQRIDAVSRLARARFG